MRYFAITIIMIAMWLINLATTLIINAQDPPDIILNGTNTSCNTCCQSQLLTEHLALLYWIVIWMLVAIEILLFIVLCHKRRRSPSSASPFTLEAPHGRHPRHEPPIEYLFVLFCLFCTVFFVFGVLMQDWREEEVQMPCCTMNATVVSGLATESRKAMSFNEEPLQCIMSMLLYVVFQELAFLIMGLFITYQLLIIKVLNECPSLNGI